MFTHDSLLRVQLGHAASGFNALAFELGRNREEYTASAHKERKPYTRIEQYVPSPDENLVKIG